MATRGLNKVQIIGNLGRDPEMRYTPAGKAVTNFTVAVGRVTRDPNGDSHEETEWFRVVAWDRLAETCQQYLKKGSKVYIEGRLQTRQWEGQDGQKRYTTELVANTIQNLERRPRDDSGEPGGTQVERPRDARPAAAPDAPDADYDDLPF